MKKHILAILIVLFPFTVMNKTNNKTFKIPTTESKKEETKKFVWEKPSEELVSLIKAHEGFNAEAYICPAGKITIGYGHRTSVYKRVSKETAYIMLLSDLDKVNKVLPHLLTKSLSESQYEALLSFCFNVGVGNFEKSTLRQLINENPDNPEIAAEFAKWRKGGGRVLRGLVKRRKDEATMYFNGNLPKVKTPKFKCLLV